MDDPVGVGVRAQELRAQPPRRLHAVAQRGAVDDLVRIARHHAQRHHAFGIVEAARHEGAASECEAPERHTKEAAPARCVERPIRET